ncbi:MAG: DinB family protein [SAR202 cluster bacterium]|nr:DinB family protein [SAR202 cluster bacterium]
MPGKDVSKLIEQIEIGYEALGVALKGITEAELRRSPGGEEWSSAQVLGHVIEMGPFWAAKVKAIAQEGGDIPAKRTPPEVEQRLAAVANYGKASLADIRKGLAQSKTQCAKEISAVKDAELDVKRKRGDEETTLRKFIESHITGHVQEHAQQMAAARKAK